MPRAWPVETHVRSYQDPGQGMMKYVGLRSAKHLVDLHG
jgi:hypothetical protein